MAKKKPKKTIRADFRKRHDGRTRKTDFTREFNEDAESLEDSQNRERVSGKGNLTRKRTVVGTNSDDQSGFQVELDVDPALCQSGRVVRVHGLTSIVTAEDGICLLYTSDAADE